MYVFIQHRVKENIHDQRPFLFPKEYIAYGTHLKLESGSLWTEQHIQIVKDDAEKQYKKILEESEHLKSDLAYFFSTYKWIEKDGNRHFDKCFWLFNNLYYQLRKYTECLYKYHEIIFYSIIYDWKDEILQIYNRDIKDGLDDLYNKGIDCRLSCMDTTVLDESNISEILRCLSEHPNQNVSEEFVGMSDRDFNVGYILREEVIFGFEHILPSIVHIREIIDEIADPKYAQRSADECVIIYDTLFKKFKKEHPDLDQNFESELNQHLVDYGLEKNKKNVFDFLHEKKSSFFQTPLGKIWDRYHAKELRILVERLVNAKANYQDYDEYFEYVSQIEYLQGIAKNLKNAIESPDEMFERLTREAIRKYLASKKWKQILKPYKAAILAGVKTKDDMNCTEFNKRFGTTVSTTAFSHWLNAYYAPRDAGNNKKENSYEYTDGEIRALIEDYEELKKRRNSNS